MCELVVTIETNNLINLNLGFELQPELLSESLLWLCGINGTVKMIDFLFVNYLNTNLWFQNIF